MTDWHYNFNGWLIIIDLENNNSSSNNPPPRNNSALRLSLNTGLLPAGRATCESRTAYRFVPNRSAMNMSLSKSFFNNQIRLGDVEELSPNEAEYRRAVKTNLQGDRSFRILALHSSGPHRPERNRTSIRQLYSGHARQRTALRTERYISSVPDRILDAPELRNDFYLNLLDWSKQHLVGVSLDRSLYTWNSQTGDISLLHETPPHQYLTSIKFSHDGSYLAVGNTQGEVRIWDVQQKSGSNGVLALSWRCDTGFLTSGDQLGNLHHHDVRVRDHHVGCFVGHKEHICGLSWSSDGRYLASGADDNVVNIWDSSKIGSSAGQSALHRLTQHQCAIKAIDWCPWQRTLLATGGGSFDRTIKIWNGQSGVLLKSVNTDSQVSSVLWSTHYQELVSGHGSKSNLVSLWHYPQMSRIKDLKGHRGRVLKMALSPDGERLITSGADETLRIWKIFELGKLRPRPGRLAIAETDDDCHPAISSSIVNVSRF